MHLKRYTVTSDLAQLQLHPVCKTVSRAVNSRIIDTYRVALEDGEHLRYECIGAPEKKDKKVEVQFGNRTVDVLRTVKRFLSLFMTLIYIFLAYILGTNSGTGLMLYSLGMTLLLLAVILVPFAILLYVGIVQVLKKKIPAIAEITQVYYMITDRRLVYRYKDDVEIIDLKDILCVVPREVDITCGNVKIGLATENHELYGIFNVKDWAGAGHALQKAVDECQQVVQKQDDLKMNEDELIENGQEMEIPDLDTSALYKNGVLK